MISEKAKDPYSSQAARVSTDHSGASPVASALGIRLGATLADAITLTRTRKNHASKGTFLPCWKRGHFHFALTRSSSGLTAAPLRGSFPYEFFQASGNLSIRCDS